MIAPRIQPPSGHQGRRAAVARPWMILFVSLVLLLPLTAASAAPSLDTAEVPPHPAVDTSLRARTNELLPGLAGASRVTAVRGSLTNTDGISRRRGFHPTLRRIRVGTHDGFDRVVFEFEGRRPRYLIGYTSIAESPGGGVPIRGPGTVALQVVLGASTVQFTPGSPRPFRRTFRPVRPLTPRFPTLRQVRDGGQFECTAIFAVGLRGRSGFRVLELVNPTRLAIDVAHGARVRLLRRGTRGDDVRDWQVRLNTVQDGRFAVSRRPSVSPLALDGVFGPNTARATRVFQRAEGAAVDGVVGPETRAAMRRAIREASRISP